MDHGNKSYEKFLSGDDTGMEEIIKQYSKGLIFYLYKLVGSLNLAEDLAEDTFVLLCTKKPKNKQKSTFKTWLYTIGRNLAIDQLRRMSKRKNVPVDNCINIENSGGNPEDEYLRDQTKIIINKAIYTLKPEYQQILWLVYFEELSYNEISQIIHKSTHATEMLASRAKQALKKQLIKEGINNENN